MGASPSTLSATRRRNVKPTTSVLHVFVEDVDCSGTTFANGAPEDGQFVVVQGKTATNTFGSTYHDAVPTNVALNGSGLRMVWGSAQRSDRAATGEQRVPVMKRGAVRIKTKLFNVVNTNTGDLTDGTNNYVAGRLLTVQQARAAVQGTAERLVLEPLPDGSSGWTVGYLERVVTNSTTAGRGEIEAYLYDSPRFVDK